MTSAAAPRFTRDNWRDELLRSLRDTGVQRAQRDILAGIVLPGLGVLVVLVVGLFVEAGFRSWHPYTAGDRAVAPFLYAAWILVSIFLLGRAYNAFVRRIWRTHARNAEEELERAGARPPILYLRSFRLDDAIDRPAWYDRVGLTLPRPTREQRMTAAFRPYGPVLAIGRPDEKLPALGAARFYCGHDHWQEKVDDVAKCAQLVVWASGATEGLRWELTHLIRNLPPERLVIWTHPHVLKLGEDEREKEWQRFLNALGTLFPQPLPNRLGSTRFIYFGENYQPIPASSANEMLGRKNYPVFSLDRWSKVMLVRIRKLDWKNYLFGFRGRINRAKFWLAFAMYQLVIMFWIYLGSTVWQQGSPLMTGLLLAALVPAAAVAAKRLHDRGRSAWWLLLYYLAPAVLFWLGTRGPIDFMPLGAILNPAELLVRGKWGDTGMGELGLLLNLATLVDLGFLRGTRGPNRYGDEPHMVSVYDWLEGEPRPKMPWP